MNPGSGVSHRDADYAWCKKNNSFIWELGIGKSYILAFIYLRQLLVPMMMVTEASQASSTKDSLNFEKIIKSQLRNLNQLLM